MLPGLRHDAVIGGNYQDPQIDAVEPSNGVLQKISVAGDIDDGGPPAGRQVHGCDTGLDGHAATLLLRLAVRVHAGQAVHQRRLAVVDMPGESNREMAFHIEAMVNPFGRGKGNRTSSSWVRRGRRF